ncbi:MAG: hypothetical protein FJ279_34130, partial [Planctomycetes bacterium]|nr:hypothetical protein [Planctomycetota bacterium]
MKDGFRTWWLKLSGATNGQGVSGEKAALRLGMLVLFYGLAVLLASRGEPPLDIRPGEEAQHDYVARIEFTCDDMPETGRQRWMAEYEEPNVYLNDAAELEMMRKDLAAFLEKARTSTETTDAAQPGPVTWQSSASALTAFQQELQAIPPAKMDEALNALATSLSARGVMTGKESDDEQRRGHDFIHVFSADSPEGRRVPMARTVRIGPEVGGALVEPVAAMFPDRSPQFRLAFIELAAQALRPSLKFHKERTEKAKEAARNAVPVQQKVVRRGAVMLARGTRAEMQHVRELTAERGLYAESMRWSVGHFRKMGGAALVVLMAFIGCALYVSKYSRPVVRSNTRLFMLCGLCIGVVAAARLVMWMGWSLHVIPVCFAALTLCIAYDQRFALALTIPLVLLIGILAGNNYALVCVLFAGCAAGIACTASIRNRQ